MAHTDKALLERPRIRAPKGNDVKKGLGGVLIQGKEEDFSLRPRPEKETLKISRRRQYMQNRAPRSCSYDIINIADYLSKMEGVQSWSFCSKQGQAAVYW